MDRLGLPDSSRSVERANYPIVRRAATTRRSHTASGSPLTQDEIDNPAAADMRSRPAAVVKDVVVVAARILQRVGHPDSALIASFGPGVTHGMRPGVSCGVLV